MADGANRRHRSLKIIEMAVVLWGCNRLSISNQLHVLCSKYVDRELSSITIKESHDTLSLVYSVQIDSKEKNWTQIMDYYVAFFTAGPDVILVLRRGIKKLL